MSVDVSRRPLLCCTGRRRQWHPTPVLLPGKSHGRRILVGCSPWCRWELDTTQWLHFHFSLSCIREGNSNPLQCSCLENLRDGGAWWAAVYGVAQSWTRVKRLSSSSSSFILFHEMATLSSILDFLFFFLLSSKIKTNKRDQAMITRKMWVWEVWEIRAGLELVLPWRTGNHSVSRWPESTPKTEWNLQARRRETGFCKDESSHHLLMSAQTISQEKNVPLPRGLASFSQDVVPPVRTTGAASNTSWQLQKSLVAVLIPLSFPSVCRWFKFDPSGGKKVSYQEAIIMLVDFSFKKKWQDCDLQEPCNCGLCWEFDTHSEHGVSDTVWG